jgi:hypothetical protein
MSDNEEIQTTHPTPTPSRLQMPVIHLSGGHLIMLVLAVLITWYVTKHTAPSQAITETQMAQFQALSDRVDQLAGHVISQSDLESKIKAAMGSAFTSAVAQQNGTLTNIATAIGQIQGQLAALKVTPNTGTKTAAGGFQDVKIEQNRNGAPPLAGVTLAYDPAQPGVTGISGVWNNHTEKFVAQYGEWRTASDGARSAMTLNREVYDGSAKVGEEKIPLINGDAFFSVNDIARTAPSPKYTFLVGSSYDVQAGKTRLAGLIGKQITPVSGVVTGYVNNAWTVMYSYRFGAK